jgi:hypothetical protein
MLMLFAFPKKISNKHNFGIYKFTEPNPYQKLLKIYISLYIQQKLKKKGKMNVVLVLKREEI